MGQAAVSANIVSTVVLIIVALTGLGNFVIPDYSAQIAIAYYRILLCITASLGGLLGIAVTGLCTTAVLCTFKSFGVPFMTPFAPIAKRSGSLLIRKRLMNRKETADWTNPRRKRA